MRWLTIAALIALAGCGIPEEGPRACVGGKVYQDTRGDGVFTLAQAPHGGGPIPCAEMPEVRPARALEARKQGER